MGINPNEPYNLYNFRKTVGDPARPFLFMITIPPVGDDTRITAMARSAQIPGKTNGEVAIQFQGMNMYVGSTPTYEEWQVTFLCDEAHELRRLFLKWSSNVYDAGVGYLGNSGSYKVDSIGVAQLARNNIKVCKIGLVGAWPKNVGPIELNQGTTGEAETFQVSFRYDYWVDVDDFGTQTKAQSDIRPTRSVVLDRPAPLNLGSFHPQV